MLAVLAATAHLFTTVSFEPQTTSAADIFKRAGMQIGKKIECEPVVGREIIGIATGPVEFSDFAAHLTKAVDAQIKEVEGGYRIVRTDDDIKRRRQREEQSRIKTYRKLLGKLKLDGEFTSDDAERLAARVGAQWKRGDSGPEATDIGNGSVEREVPAARFAARILASLTDRELAGLGSRDRFVYATTPTRMQRPLPAKFSSILATFEREQNRYAQSVKPYWDARPFREPFGLVATQFVKPFQPAARMLAIVEGGPDYISCRIHGMESDGEPAFYGTTVLRSDELESDPEDILPAAYADISDLARRVRQSIDDVRCGKSTPVAPEVLRAILEEREPLDRFLRPILAALQKETGQNILVVGDDSLWLRLYGLWANPKIRLRKAEAVLSQGSREIDVDGRWRVYASKFPVESSANTADRDLMHELIKKVSAEGRMSLSTYGQFARKQPLARSLEVPNYLLNPINPGLLPDLGMTGLAGARIYAMLNPPARDFAASCTDAELLKELQKYVFGAETPVSYDMLGVKQLQIGGPDMTALRYDLLEPTNAFPDGIPAGVKLPTRYSIEIAASIWGKSSGRFPLGSTAISPDSLAMFLDSPSTNFFVGGDPSSWLFRPTQDQSWTFTLPMNDYANISLRVRERMPLSKRLVPLSQLPKPYLDQVSAARRPIGSGGTASTARRNPPPR